MTPELNSASIYTDFSGLNELRRQAKDDPDATLRQVAEQFEAIFMQMMLKSMRDANFGDPLFDSDQSEFYQSMHDQQMSLHLSKQSGIGLADMLVQQLSKERTVSSLDHKTIESYQSAPAINRVLKTYKAVNSQQVETVQPLSQASGNQEHNVDSALIPGVSTEANSEEFKPFEGPADFIKRIWNMAKDAASELGTHPAVLVAQAALETGWGKAIQKDATGKNSFNLFNIKADARWDSDKITVNTVEYRNGVAHKERADFRAYSSLEESFNDYVDFVKHSPRYKEAVDQASDPEAFIDELHKAGYATDPNYSNKIKGIMNRGVLEETLSSIKVSENETLS